MKFTNKTKLLALLMALMLMITAVFVGCGSEDKKDDDKKDETTVAEEKTTKADKDEDEDKDEDKNADVDEDTEIGEPNSGTYSGPGTKGFTLNQLETALVNFAESCDISYLDQFTLYKSDEIVDYMIANISNGCNGDMELSSELCTDANHWISNNFDWLREQYMTDFTPSDVKCQFSAKGGVYDDNLETYRDVLKDVENPYYAEKCGKNFYQIIEESVDDAFSNETEKVEYKSLSYVEVGIGSEEETSFENILVIETNVGYFLLLDIPDTN